MVWPKSLLLTITSFVFSATSFSQGFNWIQDFTSSAIYQTTIPLGVAYDSSGFVYTTGSFEQNATIGGVTVSGTSTDGFLVKMDTLGNVIWIETFSGNGNAVGLDVVTDNNGGVYVSGICQGANSFDTISISQTATFYYENFLVKFNGAGNVQWLKNGAAVTSSLPNWEDSYVPSKLDFKDGHLVFGGYFMNPGTYTWLPNPIFDGDTIAVPGQFTSAENTFIASYLPDGTQNWLSVISSSQVVSSSALLHDMKCGPNHEVVALLSTRDSVFVNNTFVGNNGSSNANDIQLTTLKLNGSGSAFAYHEVVDNGIHKTETQSLGVSNAGEVYVGATRIGGSAFYMLNTYIGGYSGFIYKLDSNLSESNVLRVVLGNSLSSSSRPYTASVEVGEDGYVYLAGSITGAYTVNNVARATDRELFYAKLDTSLTTFNYFVESDGGYQGFPFLPYYPRVRDMVFDGVNMYSCGMVEYPSTILGSVTTSSTYSRAGYITKIVPCNPISAEISPDTTTSCGGTTPVSFSITGNPSLNYQWYYNNVEITGVTSTTYSTSNPGTYYAVVDSAGCLDTSNIAVISQGAGVSVSVPTTPLSVCSSVSSFTLTGGTPSGGVWSGNGVLNDSIFDPSVAGAGPTLVTYTYTSPQGCADSAVRVINVTNAPTVIVSPFLPTYCTADNSGDLTALAFPQGGTFSGSGVSGNEFHPDSAGAGIHTIMYTYDLVAGCPVVETFDLVVNQTPVVSLPANGPVCESDPAFVWSGVSPTNGIFVGTGMTDSTFTPSAAGVGQHQITYSVTSNGCSAADTQSIQVDGTLTASLSNIPNSCINDAAVQLTQGSPQGGMYLVNGITTTSLQPNTLGIGVHTVQYIVTNQCGNDTASTTFEVLDVPTITIPSIANVCEDEAIFNLPQALPAGGVFSGNGVVNSSQFDPSLVATGIHWVSYSYTNTNGCTATDSISFEVFEKPNLVFVVQDSICLDAGALTLAAQPTGGSFFGTGVSGSDFNPAVAGVGQTVISYTFTNANNCTDTIADTIIVYEESAPTLSNFSPLCVGSSVITLTGGTPLGGVYSGTGISNGQFDPSISGVGVFDVIYTVQTSCGPKSDTAQIQVLSLPTVSLGSISSMCESASPITLTTGSPAGGTYSGAGLVNGEFDPSIVGAGQHDVMYTVTDGNGCMASDTQTITVYPNPAVSLTIPSSICEDVTAFSLSGGTPQGGVYSGIGVNNGAFNPQIAGIGTHVITYELTDSNNCSTSVQDSIVVNSLPVLSWGALSPICENGDTLLLNSATPTGGIYSGAGVQNNSFIPTLVGTGTHTLTYSYSDSNTCSNTITQTISVDTVPQVTFNAINPVCVDHGIIPLSGGQPSGGSYSGVGVSNGEFDPSVAGIGFHNVMYSYTNSNGCTNTDTIVLEVKALPVLSLPSVSDACIDGDTISLSASPAGGTYTGNGVLNGQFIPSSAGLGQHIITYSYTDGNGCSAVDSFSITVNPLPTVSLQAFGSICIDVGIVPLIGGMPTGGIYSGAGVSNSQFDPAVAGAGTHTITYEYTGVNGCSNVATSSITVNDIPSVSLSGLGQVCESGGMVSLTGGLPTGGSYSGIGTSGGQFDPSIAGVGQHIITYSYTNGSGCTSFDTSIIEVVADPVVSLAMISDVCIDNGSFILTGGAPVGGTYSGVGVTNGNFDPGVAGVGTHVITYSFTTPLGCFSSDTTTIEVLDLPVVSFDLDTLLCSNDGALVLSNGIPSGGIYSGTGVVNGEFDPSSQVAGNYTIQYTYSDVNSCANSANGDIEIVTSPLVDAGVDVLVCTGDTVQLNAAGADSFEWSTSQNTQTIEVIATLSTTYSVTGTDGSTGCQGIDEVEIVVNPIPDPQLPRFDTICSDSIVQIEAASGFLRYNWSNGAASQFTTFGPYTEGNTETIWVAVEDVDGCVGADSVSFYVDLCEPDHVSDLALGQVEVFPNPSQGVFTIKTSDWEGNLNLQLISATGAVVYERQVEVSNTWQELVDVTWLSNGMYTLSIQQDEKVYRQQILINR